MNLTREFSLVEFAALAGRIFVSSDADENDRVTGQTSFAATTPTFLLQVPAGTTAIPLFVNLTQAGTVAGGDVGINISIDKVDRYSSSGNSEKVFASRLSQRTNACTLWSGPTASAGYGVKVFPATTGPDVSPAEGAIQGPYWQAEVPYLLDGPAAFLVYTYAASTGPTWEWAIGWAEFTTTDLPVFA